jgi:6-phosphogluconolactonase
VAALTIVDEERALAVQAAERFTRHVEAAVAGRGNALVSMTGGDTPRRMYALLGDTGRPWRARIDWARVHLFWGDERHVPPEHPDSNFGMANRALIDHVPIPPAQVHRMRGDIADAAEAARDYERVLRDGFAAAGRTGHTFDLMLLGLGEDAHIASIFPDSPLLAPDADPGLTVAAVWASHLAAWRLTLTPPALLDARTIAVLVSGEHKATAVHAALESPDDLRRWPAQLLRSAGDRVEWMIDRPAAARLSQAHGPT